MTKYLTRTDRGVADWKAIECDVRRCHNCKDAEACESPWDPARSWRHRQKLINNQFFRISIMCKTDDEAHLLNESHHQYFYQYVCRRNRCWPDWWDLLAFVSKILHQYFQSVCASPHQSFHRPMQTDVVPWYLLLKVFLHQSVYSTSVLPNMWINFCITVLYRSETNCCHHQIIGWMMCRT